MQAEVSWREPRMASAAIDSNIGKSKAHRTLITAAGDVAGQMGKFVGDSFYKILITSVLVAALWCMAVLQAAAQGTIVREGITYPIPPEVPGRMFYLQRTPNTNTIACDLNFDRNGQINKRNPLTTYWLRYGDSPKGEKKGLNFIQRHYAYGLNIKQRGEGKYEFWFVSYKKYHMYLIQTKDGNWRVYGKINDKVTALNSIFIYINGGPVWNPHVEYVELRGTDLFTGKEEIQRLKDVKKDPDEGHDKVG